MTASVGFESAPGDRPAASAQRWAEVDDQYDAVCDSGGLTRRQLLIWAGNRVAPGVPVFTEAALLHIHGPLDSRDFGRAYQAVVDESDALRMVVEEVDGWPCQRVRPRLELPVDVIDLASSAAPVGALEALAREREARTIGDGGALIDTALVRLRPEHHVWLLVQHQLVADAWSFALLHRRVADHYRDLRLGRGATPRRRPQFRDYLAHERRFRGSADGRGARAYWRNRRLDTAVRPPALASSVGRDATRIHRVSHRLGTSRTAVLRRLATADGASIDTGLFGCFASLVLAHLHRTTGVRDVVLHVPFANRPSQRFKETIGSFMNVCPVRVAVEGNDTFLELRRRVAREMWAVARHQAYAVRQVSVDQPYDVLVNVHKESVATRGLDGLPTEIALLPPTHRFGAFAVGVQDFNAAGDLTVALDFNVATFGRDDRATMSATLIRLLDHFLGDPLCRVDHGPRATASAAVRSPRAPEHARPALARALRELWRRLLGVDDIGVDDDFFALGGDSIVAYRMLHRLRVELGMAVSPETFLERPSIAGILTARDAQSALDDVERVLGEIEGLSDAEAEALLDQESSASRGQGDVDHG